MELIDFSDKSDKPICLALGYFDSVHNGHKILLDECVKSGFTPAVFTFKNNPQSAISGMTKQCYTFTERVQIFAKIGIKLVISSVFDKDFMNMRGYEFLDKLCKNFNVREVVFGTDYTCGVKAEYSVEDVKNYFKNIGVSVKIIDLLKNEKGKIASRKVRELLTEGKIEQVNQMLPYPYFTIGIVEKGRNVGGSIVGYPTANISYPEDKIQIKAGVYKTHITIDNKIYLGLTNVGAHPTFDDYNFNLESFVIDFEGDLYGKQIKIEFFEYFRGISKFNNADELKAQIDSDFKRVLSDKLR